MLSADLQLARTLIGYALYSAQTATQSNPDLALVYDEASHLQALSALQKITRPGFEEALETAIELTTSLGCLNVETPTKDTLVIEGQYLHTMQSIVTKLRAEGRLDPDDTDFNHHINQVWDVLQSESASMNLSRIDCEILRQQLPPFVPAIPEVLALLDTMESAIVNNEATALISSILLEPRAGAG